MGKLLDGKILAKEIKTSLKNDVKALIESTGKTPKMVNIVIGEDYGTCAYANSQKKTAKDIGIDYELVELPKDVSQKDLIKKVTELSSDESVNGIMIHRPVPDHIDYKEVATYLDTSKDLEGINVENIGKMIMGDTKIIPCTPASVMAHIKSTGVELKGKEVVIVGHSAIVGKPLSMLLLNELATVTVCHIGTSQAGNLEDHVGRADILIVAVGKAGIISGSILKEGAIVVDVGINNIEGKIVGDVDFESAKDKVSFITPVPGGVGPVTVVMLMKNGIESFKLQNNIE